MPGHERRVTGLLDEEIRGPAQEVGAVEVFDRIEDLVIENQFVEPGEQQVRLVAKRPLERSALRAFKVFQALTQRVSLLCAHDPDRRQITVPVVLHLLFGRK